MRCPFCNHLDSRVLDSRPTEDGAVVRRRRECMSPECRERWTTYEKVEITPLRVVKKDGRREAFETEKIMAGLLTAAEKRPVSMEDLQAIVTDVERILRGSFEEVSTRRIGELVMERLRDLDQVAYVRFASVYRQFRDLETFRQELERLLDDGAEAGSGG